MAKSATPRDDREWPDYEFRPYPKHLGFDENGVDIEVADEAEEAARIADVVFPKLLGKDKNGSEVVAYVPDQEGWKKQLVVKASVPEVDPDALKDDGPTILEWVAGGYKASDYPPKGYAAKSRPEEIALAIVDELTGKHDPKAADPKASDPKPAD